MQLDRCLHVCLVGDAAVGISTFLRAYRDSECGSRHNASVENVLARVDLDGEPWCVRFTDNAGSPYFDSLRTTALSTAHVVLLCFSMDAPETLVNARRTWLPVLWATANEAPIFLIGLRSDCCACVGAQCVPDGEAAEVALRAGALAFLECSSLFPETVRRVVDEALSAAREFHGLQWQLQPAAEPAEPACWRHPVAEAREEVDGAPWLTHERLNVGDDPRTLDAEDARRGLSVLGLTPSRQHAYLRMDVPDLGLTSVDVVRSYRHLQFVNVSKNQLRTLEPLGALRCLLHLNASYNLLIRTQSFTAPDALETVDMSYNMINALGEWGVHRHLRELNLRGNFIAKIGPGLRRNAELRMLDLSENHIPRIENLGGLGLRTLLLTQNQLTSLEGIATLGKLQMLNVRHNNITSIAALAAEDVPRLRKLCISENRISCIREVEGLQNLHFLCDLVLVPNPLAQLPHYRAQAIHRLPRLRSLDGQVIAAEEKVKADLIYGADVEARREIFEQLLPEETFVDRRLVTEEGIAAMELEQFGQLGDAGPFGSLAQAEAEQVGHPQPRTRLQEAKYQQRLEQARRGGLPPHVADLASFAAPFVAVTVQDHDIPEILAAVAEGEVEQLLLGAATLSSAGVREVVAYLCEAPHLRHVDLTGCAAIGELGSELMGAFPYARGCSLEAAGCGLPDKSVERLRNKTPQAEQALRRLELERQRSAELVAAYMARQEALEDFAVAHCDGDAPPPPPPPFCHPIQWRDGTEGPALAANTAYRSANPEGLSSSWSDGVGRRWCMVGKDGAAVMLGDDEHQALCCLRDNMLREWGCLIEDVERDEECDERETGEEADRMRSMGGRPLPKAFAAAFSPVVSNTLIGFMLWEGVEPSAELTAEVRLKRQEWEAHWHAEHERCAKLSAAARQLYDRSAVRTGVANGQLIAHFTYLCLGGVLTGADQLKPFADFGLRRVSEMRRAPPRHGQDLHSIVDTGQVVIESVVGRSLGNGSLQMKLRSSCAEDLEVTVRRGTIFQHVDWQHRQNLMVSVEYVVLVPAGGSVVKAMSAYCMNSSCACSAGNPMALTDFCMEDETVLQSQASVWDHFERCFDKR